jgi:hypothetical protein
MSWFFSKPGDNELGEYLPDSEDELQEGSEPIQASEQKEADKKCQEIAEEYGGTDAKAKPGKNDGEYDCRFKFWGSK